MGIINLFRTKIINELDDKQRAFKEFIAEDVTPLFGMMAMVDTADLIGISSWELLDVLKKEPKMYSQEINQQVKQLLSKIDLVIKDKEFRDKLIAKTIFIRDYGNFEIDDQSFRGTYEIKDNKYQFELSVNDNFVKFEFINNDQTKMLSGKYRQTPTGASTIQYYDVDTTIYDLGEKNSFNIVSVKTVEVFDKDDIQTFVYKFEKHDNYYVDKISGDKTLHQPSPFENYGEATYRWRAPKNIILEKNKKDYIYPEGSDSFIMNQDSLLIGINIAPNQRRLPFGGNYTWFDKALYHQYINGECSIEDIWANKEDNYQKRLSIK